MRDAQWREGGGVACAFRDHASTPEARAALEQFGSTKPLFRLLYRVRLLKYLSAAVKMAFFKNFHNIAIMSKSASH